MTTDESGEPVPKQYCSLGPGPSLVRRAIQRASGVVALDRVVPVVVRHHARWWEKELADLPRENVVVAPLNRGTSPGLLLPLLHVVRRDPAAIVLVLPSDHHVDDEGALREALERAFMAAADDPDRVVLLGVTPTEPDPGYGWILPESSERDRVVGIAAFCEKPPLDRAKTLMNAGALWNSFMLVATARALLSLFATAQPELLRRFGLLAEPGSEPWSPWVLTSLHERVDSQDFSRDVLERCIGRLRLLRVPSCGWTDMGTPERVARVRARVTPAETASGATA
jgi:mannose-1-phosphate guanylyltransferase